MINRYISDRQISCVMMLQNGPVVTGLDVNRFRGTTKFLRKKRKSERDDTHNSDTNEFLREVKKLRKTIPDWDTFFQEGADEERGNHWVRLEILGQPLLDKYAWAIPDNTALNIAAHFAPLIEIGAGKGYWASLLRERNVQIRTYDRFIFPERVRWTTVARGGPNVLSLPKNQGRNLFLSYPDEDQEMSTRCLKYFTGEYIVHVGELLTTGTIAGGMQAPFGRTTASQFQIDLCTQFHCVMVYRLPNFPFGNDHITVWKRKNWVPGRSGKRDDVWADIPPELRLPSIPLAAPAFAHLIPAGSVSDMVEADNENDASEDEEKDEDSD